MAAKAGNLPQAFLGETHSSLVKLLSQPGWLLPGRGIGDLPLSQVFSVLYSEVQEWSPGEGFSPSPQRPGGTLE